MESKLTKYLENMELTPGVPSDMLINFEKETGFSLPLDYVDLLTITNGAVGTMGSSYVDLWAIENLIEYNRAYGVNDFVPGIFLIGSDGGNEAFGIDLRKGKVQYVKIPFVVLNFDDMITCADNLVDFFEYLYKLYD